MQKLALCLLTLLSSKLYSIATETEIKDKSGKNITLAVTTAPLFDESGEFVGGVELFRDISELKRIERERKNFLAMIAQLPSIPFLSLLRRSRHTETCR